VAVLKIYTYSKPATLQSTTEEPQSIAEQTHVLSPTVRRKEYGGAPKRTRTGHEMYTAEPTVYTMTSRSCLLGQHLPMFRPSTHTPTPQSNPCNGDNPELAPAFARELGTHMYGVGVVSTRKLLHTFTPQAQYLLQHGASLAY
jgi:hypothetical protein